MIRSAEAPALFANMATTFPKTIETSQGTAELSSSKKLEDQAATAALYVVKSQRDPNAFLDKDHKLSSAGMLFDQSKTTQ